MLTSTIGICNTALYHRQIDLNYREVALLPLPAAKWQESIQLDLGLVLHAILQHSENILALNKERSRRGIRSANRMYYVECHALRPAPSMRANLSFRYTHEYFIEN